jgi:hypothetical protein
MNERVQTINHQKRLAAKTAPAAMAGPESRRISASTPIAIDCSAQETILIVSPRRRPRRAGAAAHDRGVIAWSNMAQPERN